MIMRSLEGWAEHASTMDPPMDITLDGLIEALGDTMREMSEMMGRDGGMPDFIDPENINMEMMHALGPFLESVRMRMMERYEGTDVEPTEGDMWAALDELEPELMELGLSAETFEMLKKSFVTHSEMGNINGPHDFFEMLSHALSMVAYGVPEMMDPMEAMWKGVEMHIQPFKDRLMEEFPTWDDNTAP